MENLLKDLNKNINELESKVESKAESLPYLLQIKQLLTNMLPLVDNSTAPDHKTIINKVLQFINYVIECENVISPKSFILLAKSQNLLRMLYNVDQSYELFDEELINDWMKNYDNFFKESEKEDKSLTDKGSDLSIEDKVLTSSDEDLKQMNIDSFENDILEKPISIDDIIEKEIDVYSVENEKVEDNIKEEVFEKEKPVITGSIPSEMMVISEEDNKIKLSSEKKPDKKTGFSTSDLIEDISQELEQESDIDENEDTVSHTPFIKEFSPNIKQAVEEQTESVESKKEFVKERFIQPKEKGEDKKEHKKSPTEPVLFAEAGSFPLDSSEIFDSPLVKLNKYVDSLNYVSKGFDTILNKIFVLSNKLRNYFSDLSSDKEITDLRGYSQYIEQMKESYLNASDIQKQLLTYTTGFNENLTLLRAELNAIIYKASALASSLENVTKVQFFKCFDNILAFPYELIKNTRSFSKTEISKNEKGKQIIYDNKTYEIYHIAKLLGFANSQINLTSSNLIFLNIQNKNIAIEVDEILEVKVTFKGSVIQLEKSIKGVIGAVYYSEEKSCLLFDPIKLLN